jgi:hypothetical protein
VLLTDPTGRCSREGDDYCFPEQPGAGAQTICPQAAQLNRGSSGELRFNPDERALSRCLAPVIFKYAAIHALPGDGFDKNTLGALMAAIVQFENGNSSFEDWVHRKGDPEWNSVVPGGKATVGIPKISPESVAQIYNCEIPLTENRVLHVDLSPTYLTKKQLLRSKLFAEAVMGYWPSFNDRLDSSDYWYLSSLMEDQEFAVEMLAINLKRGVLRAKAEGLRPSILNVATWHNSGIQHPLELIARGKYGYGVGIATFFIDRAAKDLGISLPANINRYNVVEGNPRLDEKQLVNLVH